MNALSSGYIYKPAVVAVDDEGSVQKLTWQQEESLLLLLIGTLSLQSSCCDVGGWRGKSVGNALDFQERE